MNCECGKPLRRANARSCSPACRKTRWRRSHGVPVSRVARSESVSPKKMRRYHLDRFAHDGVCRCCGGPTAWRQCPFDFLAQV